MTSLIEIRKTGKFGLPKSVLSSFGSTEPELVGVLPTQQQVDFPICTYIILYIMNNFRVFWEALKNSNLSEFEEKTHEISAGLFWQQFYYCEQDLRNSNPDKTKRRALALARAAKNIFGNNEADFPWFWKKQAWTENRVPKDLGGDPEELLQTREKMKAFFETSLSEVGNFILVTRCGHSYLNLVISTGLVLIYDTVYSHMFLVSKKGAIQHFFQLESLGEKDNSSFDGNDVYLAYTNIDTCFDIKISKYDLDPLLRKMMGAPSIEEETKAKAKDAAILAFIAKEFEEFVIMFSE